jgi:hypothetical protein
MCNGGAENGLPLYTDAQVSPDQTGGAIIALWKSHSGVLMEASRHALFVVALSR